METRERLRLPIAQIESLFPEHWILIDEPEVDASDRLVSGIVIFAHPDKQEFDRKASELKPAYFALRCTKKDPPDQKYVLMGMDEEQLQLGASDSFWTMIRERRKQKTLNRAALEQASQKLRDSRRLC